MGSNERKNEVTRIGEIYELAKRIRGETKPGRPKAAFERVWEKVGEALSNDPSLRLAALVGDEGQLTTRVLKTSPALPADFVIGRHSQAALGIPSETLSLRHALLRVYPSKFITRVALFDLQSKAGLWGEGEQLGGMLSNGNLMAHLGETALFVFAPGDWPSDKAEAWARFSSRRWVEPAPPRLAKKERSIVSHSLLDPGGDSRSGICRVTTVSPSTLNLSTKRSPTRWRRPDMVGVVRLEGSESEAPLCSSELTSGVLIGRYSRCQLGSQVFNTVSRIHLLLLLDESGLWAIDTASTNGTSLVGDETSFSSMALLSEAKLSIGGQLKMTWSPNPEIDLSVHLPRPNQPHDEVKANGDLGEATGDYRALKDDEEEGEG